MVTQTIQQWMGGIGLRTKNIRLYFSFLNTKLLDLIINPSNLQYCHNQIIRAVWESSNTPPKSPSPPPTPSHTQDVPSSPCSCMLSIVLTEMFVIDRLRSLLRLLYVTFEVVKSYFLLPLLHSSSS